MMKQKFELINHFIHIKTMSYFRVATVLEIREIMEKSGKMKRVKIVGKKSKNLREREKVGEKLGKSDKLS